MQGCKTKKNTQWAAKNVMTFFTSKTKAMHFSLILELFLDSKFKIGSKPISYVGSWKFLGMHWDKKLNFRININHLWIKISTRTGIDRKPEYSYENFQNNHKTDVWLWHYCIQFCKQWKFEIDWYYVERII